MASLARPRLGVLGRRLLSSATTAQHPAVLSGGPPDPKRVNTVLQEHGFAVLPSLLPDVVVDSMASKLLAHAAEVLRTLEALGAPIGVGSRASYDEVVLRSPGRFDVPMPFSAFTDEELVDIEGMAAEVLGGSAEPAFAGVVHALPGSTAQEWHADSPHQQAEHAGANLINVLVALEEITADMGPTEVLPRSHRLTNHHRYNGITEQILYQHATNSPQLVGSNEEPFSMALMRGTVLVFDDRILHRGLANRSDRTRSVGYFSYRRPSFSADTHFEAFRSLRAFRGLLSSGEAAASAVTAPQRPCSHSDGLATAAAAGTLGEVRAEFPSLSAFPGAIFADGASGAQVHESVLAAVREQMVLGSANVGGYYPTSERVLTAVTSAREAAADLFNCETQEVTFGNNATTLMLHVAQALRRHLAAKGPGGNVVLSRLEHDANAGPWAAVAEEAGCEVRWVPVRGPDAVLDLDALEAAVQDGGRTRFVAVGAASNATGSLTNVARACAAARAVGALCFVDAVHYAPHAALDVRAIGCDLMVASPYKFFGPHAGLLYGRAAIMQDVLQPYKIRTSDNRLPSAANYSMSRWEVGTQNFEAIAGVEACINYIAGLGLRYGGVARSRWAPPLQQRTTAPQPLPDILPVVSGPAVAAGRRECLLAGWDVVGAHEDRIKARFLEGAAAVPDLRVFGIADRGRLHERTATFAVTKGGMDPDVLTQRLVVDHSIFCTSGNHYCTFWDDVYPGTTATNNTGATRLGFLHYNTLEEVDRVLEVLERIRV